MCYMSVYRLYFRQPAYYYLLIQNLIFTTPALNGNVESVLDSSTYLCQCEP